MEHAQIVFNKMPTQNVTCWTAVIFGHVKCVRGWEALELAQQMRSGGTAPMTFVGMLNACASVAALQRADISIHQSYNVDMNQIYLLLLALLTCMPNVAA